MTECLVLVDNSNVFIEGQKHSARLKNLPRLPGSTKPPIDISWRYDFGRLLYYLAAGRTITSSFLVGSRPPPNDSLWSAAEDRGFQVITHDRSPAGREKAIDTELVAQGTRVICKAPNPMTLVIASGDRDIVPLAKIAHEEGWDVEMAAFSNAYNPSSGLPIACDLIRKLDDGFENFGFYTKPH